MVIRILVALYLILPGFAATSIAQELANATPIATTPGVASPGVDSPGVTAALTLYDSATVESQHLYNGKQYYVYDSREVEHQFFLTEDWTVGSVFYDGQQFEQVPLLYDIVRDQLVVRYRHGFGNVTLQNRKVRSFTLDGHDFMRVEADTGRVEGLRTGFYDQIYTGTTKVLARRRKERLQQLSETKITIAFPVKDQYYLYKNGEYQPVQSKRSVLMLLPEHKRQLKRELRKQNLSFRQNREEAIKIMAARYDELTKR
ncbi:hypothetical protein [Persicitalea jodogahamensis]|uniref:Uncharacterized protein n=1 Tax=Persicitalea jodogahamensis TaxID=402147 RepID=A0A8J3D530_9BACT|nr:hypothetical protein [Persicitalea jodogahamensis]GHB54472.1 hypothetical protein GCM10007390_04370 [Persicitalea jodogahamensis]